MPNIEEDKVKAVDKEKKNEGFKIRERWVRAIERANHVAADKARLRASGVIPWDDNWDRREPQCMVRPLYESDVTETALEARMDKIHKYMPRVNRRYNNRTVLSLLTTCTCYLCLTCAFRLILVRHGQYHYKSDADDDEHMLTDLGREQARLTGVRLKEYLHFVRQNFMDKEGNPLPVNIRVVNSTMRRARETKEEIMTQLGENDVQETLSDDLIQEGAPIVPEPPISPSHWPVGAHDFFQEGGRIEAGFRRYVHRADPDSSAEEVDVLVCHGNVIRYFVCRALQLPPDAWLRQVCTQYLFPQLC